MVNARDHGVYAGVYPRAEGTGLRQLPLDQVFKLRDHGVSAEKIKRANEKAGTKLPLDMVRSMADGGGLR